MTVISLFHQWNALRTRLADPLLPEDEIDRLARESMLVINDLTHAPSAAVGEVLLKLEIYTWEIQAGPCRECDALLTSVLYDRIAILGQLSHTGMPAVAPLLMEHPIFDDDIALYAPRRGQDLRSPYS